jgi:hypothetical protein
MILVVLESEASSLHGWFRTFVRTKCLRVQTVTTSAKLFRAASLPDNPNYYKIQSILRQVRMMLQRYSSIAVQMCMKLQSLLTILLQ